MEEDLGRGAGGAGVAPLCAPEEAQAKSGDQPTGGGGDGRRQAQATIVAHAYDHAQTPHCTHCRIRRQPMHDMPKTEDDNHNSQGKQQRLSVTTRTPPTPFR